MSKRIRSFSASSENDEYLDGISWGKRSKAINRAIDKIRSEEAGDAPKGQGLEVAVLPSKPPGSEEPPPDPPEALEVNGSTADPDSSVKDQNGEASEPGSENGTEPSGNGVDMLTILPSTLEHYYRLLRTRRSFRPSSQVEPSEGGI